MASARPKPAEPMFFATPERFRAWLLKHHETAKELLVGFYKVDSGRPSLSWSESVDEALCVGWIDGVRRYRDEASYTIRFSPRRAGSTWSAINIRKVETLIAQGRMQPAGLAAYAARTEDNSAIYAYEQRRAELSDACIRAMKKDRAAWAFFQAQPPSYRKLASWWIESAKKEETRAKRLQKLIECSAQGKRI